MQEDNTNAMIPRNYITSRAQKATVESAIITNCLPCLACVTATPFPKRVKENKSQIIPIIVFIASEVLWKDWRPRSRPRPTKEDFDHARLAQQR